MPTIIIYLFELSLNLFNILSLNLTESRIKMNQLNVLREKIL